MAYTTTTEMQREMFDGKIHGIMYGSSRKVLARRARVVSAVSNV